MKQESRSIRKTVQDENRIGCKEKRGADGEISLSGPRGAKFTQKEKEKHEEKVDTRRPESSAHKQKRKVKR